ncbi:class I SAM-dependent methyltransferase [Auraticoccus monumenti]|uniref:Methyltransferase domain-containing protein n=1 Tax=Auraticoccus monumenti TaxID=675864 RepID=A0A1G7ELD3_9ACTN|nr:class I SAM-dependent methyltransferase [Auraticoccus monumenti]SDE64226.1 Methyltransferase domain-containing protein [Auraticoccus monumenti]
MTPTPTVGRAAFVAARARAVRGLRGRVLEIGAGRGANFADLGPGVEWLGLESAAGPRRRLAVNARRHGHLAPPIAASAESVPLPASSVDGVLGTTVLCSVRDPAAVLDEVARVLVPGGRLVLAEHVAAPPGSGVRALQQAVRPWTRLLDHGCDPTRDTAAAVARSPLRLETVTWFLVPVLGRLGVPFVVIEASAPR